MPETEPITVRIRADTAEMETALKQGKQSLKEFGDETENVEKKQLKLFRSTTSVFGGLLALRGAVAAIKDLSGEWGKQNALVAGSLDLMANALNILIVVQGLYQAKAAVTAIYNFLVAKSAFLAGIANVSAATLFLGTAAAIGVALAAWAIISSQSAPRAQFGGIIPARAGGTHVLAGEAGQTEVILPLDRLREFGLGGSRGDINITMNVQGDSREIAQNLGREIQRQRVAGA